MACITLVFEFWYYKLRKGQKIFGNDETANKFGNSKSNASIKNSNSFGSTGGLIDTNANNSTLKARYPPGGNNFRARF